MSEKGSSASRPWLTVTETVENETTDKEGLLHILQVKDYASPSLPLLGDGYMISPKICLYSNTLLKLNKGDFSPPLKWSK